MKRIILIIVIVLFSNGVSLAQQGADLQCDADNMAAAISVAQSALEQAQAALDAEDMTTALDLFQSVADEMVHARSQCNGWYFEGNGTDSLGPLVLEGGVYIVEYASEAVPIMGNTAMGVLSIDFENLDEDEFFFDQVFEGRTQVGEFSGRKTVRLEGGRYLISVDASGLGDWTITLIRP